MTLTEMQELGEAGYEIHELLHEINVAVRDNKTVDGEEFSNDDDEVMSLAEYVQDSINIIYQKLTQLKSKY